VERSQTDFLFYQVVNPKPFTGSTTLLHENGARKFDGAFKDGRREGEGMEWYHNGKLRYEGMFKGDRLYEGFAFWYYVDSGAVKMRANYVKGQLVRGLHWNRNGDLFR
jgi:antitoxin component YwqK of YwqJK toxin-antitoxin module